MQLEPRRAVQAIAFALAFCFAVSASALDDNANDAKSDFNAHCIVCHGVNGAGTPVGKSMKAPDLRSDEIQKKKDAELAQSINEGKGNMPPFNEALSPQQIQALVAHVRELGKAKPQEK